MNKNLYKEVIIVLEQLERGEIIWKHGKDVEHVEKRKEEHIPSHWTLKDYNSKIQEVCLGENHEIYIYYKRYFKQNYYVFGNKDWIVIVGADGIMETAFPPDDYAYYLREEKGYKLLGTVKEVKNHHERKKQEEN